MIFRKGFNWGHEEAGSRMEELMCRKGSRAPLTNRFINGLADSPRGSEVHGGTLRNSLLAGDFAPWDLNSLDDYVRKDEKQDHRGGKHPIATNVIARDFGRRIYIFCAVYGEGGGMYLRGPKF